MSTRGGWQGLGSMLTNISSLVPIQLWSIPAFYIYVRLKSCFWPYSTDHVKVLSLHPSRHGHKFCSSTMHLVHGPWLMRPESFFYITYFLTNPISVRQWQSTCRHVWTPKFPLHANAWKKNHEMDWSGKIPISSSWSLWGTLKHPFPMELCKSLSFCAMHHFAQNRAVDVVMCSARISQSTFYLFLTFQIFSQTL
jgi:hypothetical protein